MIDRLVERCGFIRSPIIIVLVIFQLSLWSAVFAEKLTLEESIKLAVQNNPRAHIALENVKKAYATVDEATSQGMPKLSLEGTYQRLDEVSVVRFGEREIPLGSLYTRTADLILTQPLDVFGIVRAGKRTAKYNTSASKSEYEQVINDITLETKKAFFNVLRAEQFLKVQEENVKALEAHLADAKAHLAAGTVAQFEVLRAETQVANARQQLIIAQNGLELAKSAFNNVLARPLDAQVDLAEPEIPQFAEVNLKACVDVALSMRPEIKKAEMQVKAAEEVARVAMLAGKPRINLRWAYNRSFDVSTFSPRESSWRAFLTASYYIFDGGATKASVRKATSDAKSAKSMREQTMRGVTLDVQQAYLSLRESQERIKAAEKALEQARESMRLAQVRYQGGVSTQVEVFDAQAALTLAQTNYVNAIYDYQIALAQLERAVGGPSQMAKLLGDRSKN
ncbi:MAG: TolC family protein [Armatimonadota bacterium]|nr:TolC family protein [Armatimonadota bacterium]